MNVRRSTSRGCRVNADSEDIMLYNVTLFLTEKLEATFKCSTARSQLNNLPTSVTKHTAVTMTAL